MDETAIQIADDRREARRWQACCQLGVLENGVAGDRGEFRTGALQAGRLELGCEGGSVPPAVIEQECAEGVPYLQQPQQVRTPDGQTRHYLEVPTEVMR